MDQDSLDVAKALAFAAKNNTFVSEINKQAGAYVKFKTDEFKKITSTLTSSGEIFLEYLKSLQHKLGKLLIQNKKRLKKLPRLSCSFEAASSATEVASAASEAASAAAEAASAASEVA